MQPCYDDVENGGLRVSRSGGIYAYRAGENQQHARSESIWCSSLGRTKLTIGQRVIYSFDIRVQLGSPGHSVWQTVSQLHGPTTSGVWPGPPVALVIESGEWRIEGGFVTSNDSQGGYVKRLSTVKVDTWQHWTFDVLLGGPRTGAVTAWLDGTKVLDAFKPPRGTMYTDGGGSTQTYLQLKTGLYTAASDRVDIPTWSRTVLIKNVRSNIG